MANEKTIYPSGSSSFFKIRSSGLLYIDKTQYIHELSSNKGFTNWFLARPRRFGKTLFIDTLEHFFRGDEKLFKGLAIDSKGYDFKQIPVLRLNMARSSDSTTELKSSIIFHLAEIASKEELSLKSQVPGDALEGLILDLKRKYDNQLVAVLIDECDKPILDHLNDPMLAEEMRNILRNCYLALKNVEDSLRFVFITGISKFAITAVHSALNNLKDITHWPKFAGICGFTEEELINNFSPLFDEFLSSLISAGIFKPEDDKKILINTILEKYKGYSWDGETVVLNPYSINNCFSEKTFSNFWMNTGPPLFLDRAISQNPTAYLQPNLEDLVAEEVDKTDIENLGAASVLFQTGYLTISKITDVPKETFKPDGSKFIELNTLYSLKVPNREVLHTYKKDLFQNLFPSLRSDMEKKSCHTNIVKALVTQNATKLADILHSQLAEIPYPLLVERAKMWKFSPEMRVFHFHAAFLNFFDGLGLETIPKAMSSQGRCDIDVILPNDVYAVLKLKYIPHKTDKDKSPKNLKTDMDKMADEAISQLLKSLQDRKYKKQAGKIILVGVVIYGKDIVLVKFADSK